MKPVNILLYGGSFLGFLAALAAGEQTAAALVGLPFFLLLGAAVHEGGHCLGCLIAGRPLREVRLPMVTIGGGKLRLNSSVSPVSYCAFQKGKGAWLVYLMGPGASVLLWVAVLAGYAHLRSPILLSGSILAFCIAAGNLIPFGKNDMAMLLREIQNRNGYTK